MNKRSIFYLDDNEDMLGLFRAACGDSYEARTASSPAEGLRILNSGWADIIISDQRMPEMQGTEFLRRAHQLCPKSLRILLTGEANFGEVFAEVREGTVEFFIRKPWDPVEMRDVLERASLAYEGRKAG